VVDLGLCADCLLRAANHRRVILTRAVVHLIFSI
jgi:hypothetical protein